MVRRFFLLLISAALGAAADRSRSKPRLGVELRERDTGPFFDELVQADAVACCQEAQPRVLGLRKSNRHRDHGFVSIGP